MNWVTSEQGSVGVASTEKSREYEDEKSVSLPVIEKEADSGFKPFDPIEFQPVRSPGIYEGEFAAKDNDIIFHFWPDGFHVAQRSGKAVPRFKKDFEEKLSLTFKKHFGETRVDIQNDPDIGAWFIKANGWGKNEFLFELCVKACEALHAELGGEPG